ncbi:MULTISPECIES: protein kinase domain-containing protein [Giesbergeria]|uniref:non-specific serine/threonine protein kinase n=1 Tax=Giesbergeria sinuosa TaxID=80883 RepID=A0ABV9QIW2_9BURK
MTAPTLKITAGQYSDAGRKEQNQDFHGLCIPQGSPLQNKGIAIALADGISSSQVSQMAAQSAVTAFLEDYYCTSDAWSVKTSAERVLTATNSWLHAQTQQSQHRYDKDRGYVCTFSGLILKSTTAHLFHVGDTRIYKCHDGRLELLTEDHRVWVSAEQSYLARALGIARHLEIDYSALPLSVGDVFLLASDGVYEFIDAALVIAGLQTAADLNLAAQQIVQEALRRGSGDNLTLQIVRIDQLPEPQAHEMQHQLSALQMPPLLEARMEFDGYQIIREIKASHRSHIYLAVDGETGQQVVIKTPSVDLQTQPTALEHFLMEEWIARRIHSPHVLKSCPPPRERHYLYVVTEYVEGQTLAQWMTDHPHPDLARVRALLDQIAKGLRAFHRLEMVHQDLTPHNILIDTMGTAKIIDFGATQVAGVAELSPSLGPPALLGATSYAAPEYFLGENGSVRSDIYALGVIAYQMLSGQLPYGAEVPKARTRAAQRKLRYCSVLHEEREIPAWVDDALRKAVHPDPWQRYGELSEFIYDLHHPNPNFLHQNRPPLIERHPVLFWKTISFVLLVLLVVLIMAAWGLR